MDYQKFVDNIGAMACILSVEKIDTEKYGKIRIVAGNKSYIGSIENPAPGVSMLKDKFIPNSEYTDYLTRDLNFENYCFMSAVHRKCLHSYAHPDRMNIWFNMTFLPIGPDEGDLLHCLYVMEMNYEADAKRLSNIDSRSASIVLQIALTLSGTVNFKQSMNEVIYMIRDICEAEHCCILSMDTSERTCEVLCEAFSKESKLLPMETYVDDSFYEIAESWEKTISGSNCIIANSENDMQVVKKRNPVWYESLTTAGAKNIVLFPLKYHNSLLGYIWAINFNSEMALKIKETLELSTHILGIELGNNLLLNNLKVLSSKDMLTGVMNRNEMNNYIDSVTDNKNPSDIYNNRSVSVIFSDLNGLKTINDERGHSAGDALIKEAADVLMEFFDEKNIYRAGGDEFTIIVPDMSEEEMYIKMEEIKKAATKHKDLSFSLGGCFDKDIKNIKHALRIADKRMYEDKNKYYELHPEKKKR
ncbi:MAG: GGDEF domain-containing protein [Eubacterium sp.]|nr:GGDEF domain-containing protein [Eubacterium sp.]